MWSKMWNKTTAVPPTKLSTESSTKPSTESPTDCNLDLPISTGEVYLSRRELSAWIAVCIYNRVPEEEYAKFVYLSQMPKTFLDIIQDFVCIYSPIMSDNNEKDYFHEIVAQLLDKYFGDKSGLEKSVKSIKLLNDIRFGYINESFYEDRIAPLGPGFISIRVHAIMAASKANRKGLVKQLLRHNYFVIPEIFIKKEYPYSFKVYFDILESDPLQNGDTNFADYSMIDIIIKNNFKITKTTSLSFGDRFYIETPCEYLKHGFDSKYEIIFKRDGFVSPQNALVQKMFNDSAKAGVEEFIHFITEHCGEQVIEPNLIHSQIFEVKYEVIQRLLEHQELIELLAIRMVKLNCTDDRINPDEIANFRNVINPIS